MIKKCLSVWLSLMILVFSSIPIYSDEIVRADYFLKNIAIDGENIINYELSNPFLIYNDRVYIPMDQEVGRIMGFEADTDQKSRILKIRKTDAEGFQNVEDSGKKNNLEPVQVLVRTDMEILAYTERRDAQQSEETDAAGQENAERKKTEESKDAAREKEITVPDLEVQNVDLMGQPLLTADSTVYVPLNVITTGGVFGWSACYDSCFGVCISTDADTEASSRLDTAEADRIRGLASYIMSQNASLTMAEAQNMVYYFESYGRINSVEPQLLMAVANCESMYHPRAVSSSGCVGLMQIKVSTGNSYGFTEDQLLQVKPNIEMGSIYLGEALRTFEGDRVLAVSSYNWGIWGVKSGSYNMQYAEKVLSRYDAISAFLSAGGYV